MQPKNDAISPVSERVDPDDAPELTDEMLDRAERWQGDTVIRVGGGRPKLPARKEQISARLDPDVLAKLREVEPAWQMRINAVLRQSLGFQEAASAIPGKAIDT
jgi:uncharacterized protein (DUF4415 family)